MREQLPVSADNTFERIKRTSPEGNESWSARDLARVLEYSEFRHFQPVIEKARKACSKSNHRIKDHSEQILDMVSIGSGAQNDQSKIGNFPATPATMQPRTYSAPADSAPHMIQMILIGLR